MFGSLNRAGLMKKKEKMTAIFAFTTSTLDRRRIVLVYRLNFPQTLFRTLISADSELTPIAKHVKRYVVH
jgi:hypothetical protein